MGDEHGEEHIEHGLLIYTGEGCCGPETARLGRMSPVGTTFRWGGERPWTQSHHGQPRRHAMIYQHHPTINADDRSRLACMLT